MLRLVLAVLILLAPVPSAAQESDRQLRQRLAWTLSQQRNAETAQATARAHTQAAYDAVHARIVRDSIAALTPLPVAPVPAEPPPVVEDTTPSSPPPAAASGDFGNLPSGFVVRTDARWADGLAAGWNLVQRRGSIGFVGGNLRATYPAGLEDGHEAGVAYWGSESVRQATEVFVGVLMRYSPGFQGHSNQIKLHLWNLSDVSGNQLQWLGLFDGCRSGIPGHWTMASWGRSPISWPDKVGDCWQNNIRPQHATHTPGEWVKQEVHYRKSTGGLSNGFIRLWIDGVLVLDAQNLRYPEGFVWQEFQHATTWGGGGNRVPQTQYIEFARTLIGSR
jgi:hypothetical protein